MKTNKTTKQTIQEKIYTNTTLNHFQELPTNMNDRFCSDMIKELQVATFGHVSEHLTDEDLVYVTSSGHLYRKKRFTYDGITTKHEWTILHNNNGACGWYRTGSPALKTTFGGIIMTDGTFADFHPSGPGIKVFHIKNLRYCLVSPMSQENIKCITPTIVDNVGKEEIYIYISLQEPHGELLLGYMYPLVHNNDLNWTTSPNIKDNNVFNGWKNSYTLDDLPFYEPHVEESLQVFFKTSVDPQEPVEPPPETYMWDLSFDLGPLEGHNMSWGTEPLTPWGDEDEVPFKDVPDKEYRMDPSDGQMYTMDQFVEYYGDDTLWNMMSPEKSCKRMMIEIMIQKGEGILSSKSINHLLDKIVETFV
jgi:hypothetical protein